jgi:hypothetical protein
MVQLRNPTTENTLVNLDTTARTLFQSPVDSESGNPFMEHLLKNSVKLSQPVTTEETTIKRLTSEMSVKRVSTVMKGPHLPDNTLVPRVSSDKSPRVQQKPIVVFVLLVSSVPL